MEIPANISERIKDFGAQIADDELGFRIHRHLRALVKADARRENCKAAKMEHFRRVEAYSEFFTHEGKSI